MKNRNILSIMFGALAMGSLSFSCSEVTKIEAERPEPPIIIGFSPAEGRVGTEIKIWGDNLGNVTQAYIGGGQAGIKYRITQDTAVIYPIESSVTGVIKLKNAYGEVESVEQFTRLYPQPELTDVPTTAKAGDEIMITGKNLDVVISVNFGTEEGIMTYKSESEIIVQVPTTIADNSGKISFSYNNGSGTPSHVESAEEFTPVKMNPEFDQISVNEADECTSITFTGKNLNVVDKVLMNGSTELPVSKSEISLSVTLPEVEADTEVTLTAYYFGDQSVNIVSGFTVKNILYFAHKNVLMGARESGLQSFFNAVTGEAFAACDIKGMGDLAENDKFHFYTDYSSSTLIFGNPGGGANKFKNFLCDGEKLEAKNAKNVVKFYPVENADYASKVVSANHEDLVAIFSLPADDIVDALKGENSPTSDFKYPSWNTTDKNVILFVLYDSESQPAKVGFIHALKVSESEAKDMSKTSSVTFNCYFQK